MDDLGLEPLGIEPLDDNLGLEPLGIEPLESPKAAYSNEGYRKTRKADASEIPVNAGANTAPPPYQEPSLGEKLFGGVQAGQSLLTGITAQVEAPVSAGIKMLTGMNTEPTYEKQVAADTANRTYQPRTQAGQELTEQAGELMN